MFKMLKYRLYPTKRQSLELDTALSLCCELYNAALQERRDAWRLNRISVHRFDQIRQLKEIKELRPELRDVNSNALEDVLKRVDRTFQSFFRRVKAKQKAGYPRFRSARRYDSFTLRQIGHALQGNKLRVSKIGVVRIKLHRPVEGAIKELTIRRECGKWYALFCAECAPQPLPPCAATVGIDVGLAAFATLSDGTEIENPRWYREAQARLRRAQRKVARRKRGSNRRRKAVALLQRIHAHVRDQRADFHHKISRWLVNNHGLIAVEDLNIKGLAASKLAKSVNDAGWGYFLNMIAYKAESAGRLFVPVNPVGTSQTCLCGAEVRKTLAVRWHSCDACGLSASRDHVSAQLILSRAVRDQALTWPTAASVA